MLCWNNMNNLSNEQAECLVLPVLRPLVAQRWQSRVSSHVPFHTGDSMRSTGDWHATRLATWPKWDPLGWAKSLSPREHHLPILPQMPLHNPLWDVNTHTHTHTHKDWDTQYLEALKQTQAGEKSDKLSRQDEPRHYVSNGLKVEICQDVSKPLLLRFTVLPVPLCSTFLGKAAD